MNTQNFEQLMNLYGSIKIVCIIGAVIFLIVAAVLFFVLKIPSVFGELTGRTAKKAIEEMTLADNSGSLGASRKIGEDGLRRKTKITGVLGTARLRRKPAGNTGNLATGGLLSHGGAMTETETATTVLEQKTGRSGFIIEKSIVMIHTDEVM